MVSELTCFGRVMIILGAILIKSLITLDILCIPPSDFYDYGVALRKIATDEGFTRIRFRRLADVLGIADGDSLSKEEYLKLVETCRHEMESKYLPKGYTVKERIKEHRDTALTYEGYVKLTSDDLRWGPDIDPAIRDDPERYAAASRQAAEKMTERLLVSYCQAHDRMTPVPDLSEI